MTTWSSPQSLLLSHGQLPMASGSLEEKPTALLRSVQPRPYAGVPETSSPECFVKGQASEVKEAEILLCYQLAKFVTVIKEGVVSPLIREEDTVYKRNSRLLPPGQPNSQQDTADVTPDPRGLNPNLKCCWTNLQRALTCPQPSTAAASPRHLREMPAPTESLCCAAGQGKPPPKTARRRRP